MNEEERIKEFEERELSQLISDLRDINTYTSFKNGAYIYDLGRYQGLLLVNEIDRLNNIINELEKYMLDRRLTDIDGRTMIYQVLYKLNELRGDNK